jgi:hypothetical protein
MENFAVNLYTVLDVCGSRENRRREGLVFLTGLIEIRVSDGAVGEGTELQTGRFDSRWESFEFFID